MRLMFKMNREGAMSMRV